MKYIIFLMLLILFYFSLSATITFYYVAWYDHVNFRSQADDMEWRRRIHAVPIFAGVLAESFSFFFHVATFPLRFIYDRLPLFTRNSDRPPILMVHGWGSGSHSFIMLHTWLKIKGYRNIYAMTYRPRFRNAAKLAEQISDKINSIISDTSAGKIDVVTHSMGGILVRYAIKYLGSNGQIRRAVTIGGPHMGTGISVFVPFGTNPLQMTYKSRFLTELADGGMTPGDVSYVSIYSEFDSFVLPQHSANLGTDARNITVPYHGHLTLLYSPKVIRIVEQELSRK